MRQLPSLAACLLLCVPTVLSSKLALAFIGRVRKLPSVSLSHMSTEQGMHFGKFVIASSHVFYRSPLSAAFVNLRPIVPGHVLVVPRRIVARMEDLTEQEYHDMWESVRIVQNMLKKQYEATGFNVAVQDGRAAGQSVPHVHVHILPRVEGDFERNDDVYDELQAWAPRAELSRNKPTLDVPEDEGRKDRTSEQMAEEAAVYRNLL
jgi:bis(5'-adenosyl)-triphosphatase